MLHVAASWSVPNSTRDRIFKLLTLTLLFLFVRQGTQAVDPAIGNWQVAPPPGRADPILTTNRTVIYYKHCRPRDPLD